MVLEGYTQREIGQRLGIERSVVARHWALALANIYEFVAGDTQKIPILRIPE